MLCAAVKIHDYELAQKVQAQQLLLEQAEADAAARFGLEKPQRLSPEAMEAREKALREMIELEQRARKLEAIESRQMSEYEAVQKELERTKHRTEVAQEQMQRAKIDHDMRQEAQRKVHEASVRAAARIEQEREYTRRAEQKRCAIIVIEYSLLPAVTIANILTHWCWALAFSHCHRA